MKKLGFLLSDKFDYSKMICDDNGPLYAKSLDLDTELWSNFKAVDSNLIPIFDGRFTEDECFDIENYIRLHPNKIYVFTLTDPYFEQESDKPLVLLLKRIHDNKNILVVSKYQPEEIIKEINQLYGNERFLILNYSYDTNKEIQFEFEKKYNKILFTGSINKFIYPERSIINFFISKFPFNNLFDILKHPGYSDVGQNLKHDIINEKYISLLSQYRYILVTSSRCKLEFLKYKEVAYAGSLVFGFSPKTFTREMKNSIFSIFSPISWLKMVFMSKNRYLSYVQKYRTQMMCNRNKSLQKERLLDFVNNFLLKSAEGKLLKSAEGKLLK